MRLTSDKYMRMASGTGGLQFGGDTAAANALDDYEEGTWTAQCFDAASGGNASSTTATGYYTKIGNLVTVSFFLSNISTAGMTGGNNLYYSLPFTPASGIVRRGAASTDSINFTAGKTALCSSIAAGSARGVLLQYGDNVGDSFINVNDLTTGVSDFAVTLQYSV